MPRRIVKRPWVGRGKPLSGDAQEVDLLRGNRGAFRSEVERRAAWAENRVRLIAAGNACTRPAAWWDYESKAPRDPHRSQDEQLYVLDALTPSERLTFEAWCARTRRPLAALPRPGFLAPDPRHLLREF